MQIPNSKPWWRAMLDGMFSITLFPTLSHLSFYPGGRRKFSFVARDESEDDWSQVSKDIQNGLNEIERTPP